MIRMSISFGDVGLSELLAEEVSLKMEGISQEVERRGVLASGELRSASQVVLTGGRSGKVYRYGGGTYQASSSGEAPARRSGAFRESWVEKSEMEEGGGRFGIESGLSVSGYLLGELLENGTSRMGARPYKEKILERAMPKVLEIFGREYDV